MSKNTKTILAALFLVAYLAILVKVMVFKDIPTIRIGVLMLNFGGADASHPANFVPFRTILPYLFGHKGLIIAGVNLIGNIILLVPVGFLVPLVYRNITWKKSLALAIAAALAIELMQTSLHVGIFDIDDVILNAFGAMLGYWAFVVLAKWVRERSYIKILVATVIVVAAAAGGLYAVYPNGQPTGNLDARDQADNSGNEQEGGVPQGGDLCGGTGGIGEIVGQGNSTFSIKRNNDVIQIVNLTDKATVNTSAGPATASDLKIGDRVTLVGDANSDGSFTAYAVFVCKSE